VKQRVISTIGRMDQLQAKKCIETVIRSLSRFSERSLLILSGKSDVSANALKIGPPRIFDRLWRETGIQKNIKHLNQMVVGAIIDEKGRPICCEM